MTFDGADEGDALRAKLALHEQNDAVRRQLAEVSQVEIARLQKENDDLRDTIARVRSWSHDCRTYDEGYLQAQGHARELLDGATVFTLSANGDRGGRSL